MLAAQYDQQTTVGRTVPRVTKTNEAAFEIKDIQVNQFFLINLFKMQQNDAVCLELFLSCC